MTARNFGINRGRQRLSGASSTSPSAYSAETRADFYPLPAGSLCPDPMSDDDRSRIVGRLAVAFFSLVFLVPLILAGIMMGSR